MNEEIKYITSFSGKQYDSSEIADIISKNLEEHADYYAKKGINRDDFINSVEMLYKGLVDKTYTDVMSGFKGPAGNVLPQAVRFMKTVLQKATPVEPEVEELGYYNPNIFWNTFKTVYNVKDNYDFKDWKPGGVYNQSNDHSDATQLMSSLITDKIIPTLNQYKYKEGVTQFANVTEAENAWKAYAEALKTKKTGETGLIGNSDKALATQLGGPGLSNMLDGINGTTISYQDIYINNLKEELRKKGFSEEESAQLALFYLQQEQEKQRKPYEDKKREDAEQLKRKQYQTNFETHVKNNWYNLASDRYNNDIIKYQLNIDNKFLKDLAKIKFDTNYLEKVRKFIYGDKNLANQLLPLNSDTDTQKETKRSMFYNAVQKILQPLTKKDYDFQSNGWIKDPENGDVWIHKNSFDVKYGSFLVYDPYQRFFYRARLINPQSNNTQSDDATLRLQVSDVIANIGKAAFKIAYPMDSSSRWNITSNKKGAKLLALRKLSIGGTADLQTNEDEDPMSAVDTESVKNYFNNKNANNVIYQHPDNVFIDSKRPLFNDYTDEERQLYREGDSDNYWDTIRAWSTGADVASAFVSLYPGYGTIAGGALGVAGWLGNWVADALDPGVSREEMWTNVLINGALVPLSMIPGAKAWTQATKGATKVARAKGAMKLAGKGLVTVGAPAYGLYNTAANGERFLELWKKYEFGDDGSLTSEEFREFCNYLSIASGSFYSVKSNALKYAHVPDQFKDKLGPKTAALLGKITAGVGDPVNAILSKGFLRADALQTSYRLAPKINPTIVKHKISVVDENGTSKNIEISQTAKGLIENLINNYKKGRGIKKIMDGTNNDPAYDALLKNISNIYRKDQLVLPESAKFELSNYLKNIDDIDNIETKTFTGTDGFGNTKEVTFNKEVLQKVKNVISSEDNPDQIYTKLLEVIYPETISEIDPAKLFNISKSAGSVTDNRQNRLLLDLYNTHKGFRTSKGGSIFDPLSITKVRNAFKEQIGPLDLNRLKVKDSEIDDYINFRFKDEQFKDGDITKATTPELVTKIKESITSSDEEFRMLQEWIQENRNIKNQNRRNNRTSDTDDVTDLVRILGTDDETGVVVNTNADDTGTSSVIILGDDDPITSGVIIPDADDVRTSDVDFGDIVIPIDDTRAPVDADNITAQRSQNKPKKRGKKQKKRGKKQFGGILQELVSLRNKNFTTDITEKFSKGGIVKAQNGDNTNEWITKYNPHGGLNQYSTSTNPYTSSVKDNQYHKNGSDLSSAIDYITKYVSNYDQVTGDIQSYITDNNLTNVNDFISKYNADITNLHDKWKAQKYTYGEYGASDINDLYKKLYKSTTNQDQLDWDENLKDVFGSTTNARRVIVRNGELSSLTPEQLAKRTHTVKVNGQDVKVYVNADGTLTTTFTSNPSGTGTDNGTGNGNGNGSGNGNGNVTIHRPSSDEEDNEQDKEKDTEDYSYWGASYDPYLASVNKAYPDLLDLTRFIDNKRNNRRVWELGLKKKAVYKSPIQLKRNVYGDFGALTSAQQEGNAFMSTMARMASLTNNPEDAAAIMMDAQLRQNNIVNAGRKLDNAAIAQSAKESQQTEEAVYRYNKEVGDHNMGQAIAKFNHDLDITSAYHSADTTNNSNYTMGLEKRTRENWRDTKDAIRDTSLLQLENMRKRLVLNTPVIQDYNDRIAAETDPTKKLQLQQAKAREIEQNEKRWGKYFFDMQIAILLGKPLPDISTYIAQANNSKTTTNVFDQPPAIKTKNGGKLTNHKTKRSAEDLKELRKQIKFNITTNQKALDNLSKSVLLELKKMMDI